MEIQIETGPNRWSNHDLLFEILAYLLTRPGRRDTALQSFELRIRFNEITEQTISVLNDRLCPRV